MSWLNLNDSLNSLKGQISNFANNVLADEDPQKVPDTSTSNTDLEELQRICSEQQEEIKRLQRHNAEQGHEQYKQNAATLFTNDDHQSNGSWSWDISEAPNADRDKSSKIIADLEKTIEELRKEKQDLISNLDLLDFEHRQNTEILIGIKDKLQEDYNELEDKFTRVKQDNEALVKSNKKSPKEFEDLKVKYEASLAEKNSRSTCINCENLLKENQHFVKEIEKLTNEVGHLKSNEATLSKVLDDNKSASRAELAKIEEKFKLCESENKILVSELQKQTQSIVVFEKKSEADAETCKKLGLILEGYEQQVSSLKQELLDKESSSGDTEKLKNDLQDVRNHLVTEKELTHKKYINILTESMKKYIDGDNYTNETKNPVLEVDTQVSEFSHQVESILNILLDLKTKCENLENDLYNGTQEKTNILSEKNHEIEKLIQNSEILSQEVITKSQTIKDFENECNELIKNNDVLINELEILKTNSGLQTISESNEDNLLLLESQLENANKKIEQLENIISDYERKFVQDELHQDINEESVSYATDQKLLEECNQLVTDNSALEEEIKSLQQSHKLVSEEKDKLIAALEKLRTDLENTEYQYTEININMESLKDEVENQRKRIEDLMEQNVSLKKINMEYERCSEDIRSELNVTREKLLLEEDSRRLLESQIRSLTEKLQNAKMCETSLKLQYDTVSKELTGTNEAKCAMEASLKNTLSNLDQCRNDLLDRQEENEKLKTTIAGLEEKINIEENNPGRENKDCESLNDHFQTIALSEKLDETLKEENSKLLADLNEVKHLNDSLVEEKHRLLIEVEKFASLSGQYSECQENVSFLEKKVEELNAAKNELTNVIITKHQESVTYHNEIQRLSQILNAEVEKNRNLEAESTRLNLALSNNTDIEERNEKIDKLTDQNNFLRQKCEVLAQNLLEEQNNVQQILAEHAGPSEKEQILAKKLERLQTHLIEVEEHYTQELLRAEEKNNELQSKVNEIEQREKNSSTMYTSVSIRANQHVETLQHQLQLITSQRDELRKKISDAEDHASKQEAALANLQFVLEQFQNDKENDVRKETERIRRQINVEKRIQEDLKKEIGGLQSQLEESKHGLLAASRLADQLEQSKQLITTLKTEASQLKDKLQKSEEQLQNLSSQSDGKVDKSLIKNLVIGFVSTNNILNADQVQILKIIATVLDFSQQDHDKVNLNKPQQGWLGSFLRPQTSQAMTEESLSQAFVKFLENESKPRLVPSLLSSSNDAPQSRKNSVTVPRQSPNVLSAVVLPTFADFAQNRNSSSILKDVLKDNS